MYCNKTRGQNLLLETVSIKGMRSHVFDHTGAVYTRAQCGCLFVVAFSQGVHEYGSVRAFGAREDTVSFF